MTDGTVAAAKGSITVGSTWMAADGGHYGYRVTGPMAANGDVPVETLTGEARTIDWFKLTYRYYRIAS